MKNTFVISLLLLFFLPTVHGQVKINLQEPTGDSFTESELFETVEFIPLVLDNGMMITQDMELKYIDGQYFLLDNKFKQCIFRFDSLGNFQNIIGGEQVMNPIKYAINPYLKQAEIYNFEDSEIRRYHFDGKKIDRIPMNMNPADFIRDEKGNYWIYMGWNNKETAFRLIKADKNGNIIERQMRLITQSTPNEGYALYDTRQGICLWELFGNETFFIKDNTIKKTFRFDFGSYGLPQGYHMMPAHEAFLALNANGYFAVKKYIENDHFSYFFLNFIKTDQKELIHIIYDKRISKSYIYTEYAGIGAFDKAQALTDNDELVFLVSGRKIGQLFGHPDAILSDALVGLDEQIGSIRTPVVLKIKLHSFGE